MGQFEHRHLPDTVAAIGNPAHIAKMAKAWKIIAETERLGGAPLKEYFLVAISAKYDAIAAIKERRAELKDAAFRVVGEADPGYVEWLDVQDGDVLCVLAVS